VKIAIPVKMNKENPPLAPLFGKAKWFAFIRNNQIEITANPAHGGKAVVEWLVKEGVNIVIFQEMGLSPYEKIKDTGDMALFHAGYERILLADVLEKFQQNSLQMINDTNMAEVIARHETKHSHAHTDGH